MECASRNNYYSKEVIIKFSIHPPKFPSDSGSSGMGPKFYISNKLPYDANASRVRTIFGEPLCDSRTIK